MQKRLHFTVPHDTMRVMVKCLNLLTTMRFLNEITRFRISEVVVISVRMNV